MSSRWDWLYDLKAVSLEEHLVGEIGKNLAGRLAHWPPEVWGWSSEADRGRFEPLVAPGSLPPSDAVFAQAFRLARWEMERDYEAIDDYMRRESWRGASLGPQNLDSLVFLYKYLTEEMLAVSDATEGRIGRKALVRCLEEAERRLAFRSIVIP